MPLCPSVLSLPPLTYYWPAQETDTPSPTGSTLSQCARKGKVISIVEAMFTFCLFFLISCAQTGGQGTNAQIAWGQSAEWLGQGRRFHTQCHSSKNVPTAEKDRKTGWAIAYTTSCIPGIDHKVCLAMHSLFLGDPLARNANIIRWTKAVTNSYFEVN